MPGKLPEIAVKPLYELLDEAVAVQGQKPAMDFLGKQWSYAELGDLVNRAAAGFRMIGVTKGVKVGLCLPNTPYFVICYFAILKAGGTVVNYNPLYVERELSHQVKDSGTSIMVTLDLAQIYPKVAALLGKSPLEKIVVCPMGDILPTMKSWLFRVLKRSEIADIPDDAHHISYEQLLSAGRMDRAEPPDIKKDIAVLQYTGGTTGVPKGAILTHANIAANVEQLRQWVSCFPAQDERMLCALPFFHVFGMTVAMLVGIALGAELILLPRFEIEQILKLMVKRHPTMFPGVPTIYIAINRAMAAKGMSLDLRSIRACISGGAPLPLEVRQEFERNTGAKLVEGYGLSESSPVVTCNPFDRPVRDGSIGLPMPGTRVEIRSLADVRKKVKQGEKGEVCVVGPQVMAGYWQKPEETAHVMVDGVLRTGDVGYVDQDGFVFIVDRLKEVIICGGYNVYPRVIEEALYRHPAVAEAAVIGIPDQYRGQAPKAFVKLKEGQSATADELKTFLVDQVSRLEMPKIIELRRELPRTMVGKLSKKVLIDEEKAHAAEAATASASPQT
ncbi:MAG TPA: long-chain fatty acid--CoA ligase [Aestuariivirga sp.]|nr:long-chain fatty acid--CoA ligase [Aestuariivirga sp.]